MFIFSICIFTGLSSILIKMGTTIKYENIDVRHPFIFINVFCHQYVFDPLFVLSLAVILKPPIAQVCGMFVISLTPATAAAD